MAIEWPKLKLGTDIVDNVIVNGVILAFWRGTGSKKWEFIGWKDVLKEIRFTRYAEMRMRRRNITEAEVREALQQPKGKHFFNPRHKRWNVRHLFTNLDITLLVAYEEISNQIVVVTVYDENEG